MKFTAIFRTRSLNLNGLRLGDCRMKRVAHRGPATRDLNHHDGSSSQGRILRGKESKGYSKSAVYCE